MSKVKKRKRKGKVEREVRETKGGGWKTGEKMEGEGSGGSQVYQWAFQKWRIRCPGPEPLSAQMNRRSEIVVVYSP